MKKIILKPLIITSVLLLTLPGWAEEPAPPETSNTENTTPAPLVKLTPLQQCEALVASDDQSPLAKMARAQGCAALVQKLQPGEPQAPTQSQ